MHESDETPVPDESDEQRADAARRAADARLRTFRIGSERTLLVLPDERRDDPSPTRADDPGT